MTNSDNDSELLDSAGDTGDTAKASRQWRSAWRVHFYAGIFSMPFIVLMAITGLIILYTQPIQDWMQDDLRKVEVGTSQVSYEDQVRSVEARFPKSTVISMTTPSSKDRAVTFGLDEGSVHSAGSEVFVNPYTGDVLGINENGAGIVGLANRLHGYLNVDGITVKLPTIAALWDDEPVMREYVVFDLVLEIFGVWALVLLVSGLFIWWPRRSQRSDEPKAKRSILGVRRGTKGRARLRDLHGLSGVLLSVMLLVTVISGMAWSTYWSTNFASFAEAVTPGNVVEPPPSVLGTRGDLDRIGNKINWNTGDFPIPASYITKSDGSLPAPMRLNAIVDIAKREGMKPGYSVYFPANEAAEDGTMTYGAFTVSNSWPRKTSEARDLFIDQFSGKTLAEQKVYGSGAISVGMDTLVSTHMGTQLGWFSRILMTALCILAIWSVTSASMMFWKRRRPGTLGLPRRPMNVRLSKQLIGIAVVFGIIFPQWGVSALVVLAFDRFVIRKVRPLRIAFGQR